MRKYLISTSSSPEVDQTAAERWISHRLSDLPIAAQQMYRSYSSSPSPEALDAFIKRWLDKDQRRRLHAVMRQERLKQTQSKSHQEVTMTFTGETVDQLDYLQLGSWLSSRTKYVASLIDKEFKEVQGRRIHALKVNKKDGEE